jgi:hypothetical protein
LLPTPPANVGTGASGGAIAYTLEGAWTADKPGFVFVKLFTYITNGLNGGRAVIGNVKINDKIVGEFQSGDGLGQVTGGHRLENTGVYPINTGDVVKTRIYRVGGDNPETEKWESSTVHLRHYLYFIPPKFVTAQAPNIVVSGASYSNTEQLTGETWIDGKPIYRMVFSGTNTSELNATNTITLLPAGSVSQLVNCGGNVGSPTSAGIWFPVNSSGTYGSAQIQAYNTGVLVLLITNPSASNTSSRPYNVWVEFTKV